MQEIESRTAGEILNLSPYNGARPDEIAIVLTKVTRSVKNGQDPPDQLDFNQWRTLRNGIAKQVKGATSQSELEIYRERYLRTLEAGIRDLACAEETNQFGLRERGFWFEEIESDLTAHGYVRETLCRRWPHCEKRVTELLMGLREVAKLMGSPQALARINRDLSPKDGNHPAKCCYRATSHEPNRTAKAVKKQFGSGGR